MKYIIDIPDDRVCDYVGSTHLLMPYTMAGHKGHHDTGLNLTPYTEPDKNVKNNDVHLCNSCVCDFPCCLASEKDVLYGDSEGFDNICCCLHYIPKNYYNPESKERKQIEDEVWEFAREIGSINFEDYMKCFGIDDVMEGSAFTKYSYQEAKEKYEAWMKKKDEIRVGDEVEAEPGNKACVLYGNQDWTQVFVFKPDGTAAWWSKCAIHKTARHFPEVKELLKKMKE